MLDSFGHVSIRHPDNPGHFLMARARAPMLVEPADVMEFTLCDAACEIVGREPGKPYSERFIHGAVFEARPDVMSVVHSHSPSVVPFTVVKKQRFGAIMHMAAPIGCDVPNWDIAEKFGCCTNLLVTNMEVGRDLAQKLGNNNAALMRGHGSIVTGKSLREAVFTAIYMEVNAQMLQARQMGEVTYLAEGEVEANSKGRAGFTLERGWENWCRAAGRPYHPQAWDIARDFQKRTDRTTASATLGGRPTRPAVGADA